MHGCSGLVHWDDPEGWDGEGVKEMMINPGIWVECWPHKDIFDCGNM